MATAVARGMRMANKTAKPQKKAKRVKLQKKYIMRRFTLVLFLLVVIGSGCWYVLGSGLFGERPSRFTPELITKPRLPMVSGGISASSSWDLEDDTTPVSSADTERWNLLLVNKESAIPDDFTVDLKTLSYLDGRAIQVDSRIYGFTLELFNQAKLDGIDIYPRSAYRNKDYQKDLHDNKISEYMAMGMTREAAVTEASTIVQPSGYSEHHTGLAIDISAVGYSVLDEGFADTPAAKWLEENAYKYGFVLRYPENKQDITGIIYEPWHYRYVGVKHAKIIKENGYCLEEYLFVLRTGQLDEQPDEPDPEQAGSSEES